ncbi:MAG: hypothetical protein KDH20_00600 [Rhodocyclaceae bacterium]|nr:hypothetical protein [Rhodocyclaceae bacterium]
MTASGPQAPSHGSDSISLWQAVGRDTLIRIGLLFSLLSASVVALLIEADLFDRFYTFSRAHEDWELDEIVLALVGGMVAMGLSALVLAYHLARRISDQIAQRLAAERRLAEGRKLRSMGALLGGVSHSISNHLQPIMTLSALVQDDLAADSDQARDLQRIRQAADGACQILRRVLNFSHQDHGLSDTCRLTEALRSAVELAVTAIPSSIRLDLEIGDMPGHVALAAIDAEVIILNLVSNAIDAFGGRAGTIRIACGDAGPGTWARLTVADSGPGIPAELQERIFEPFFTTKAVGQGTGLGLSEVYGLVTRAGGHLDLRSAAGEGTEVVIYLPVVDSGVPQSQSPGKGEP